MSGTGAIPLLYAENGINPNNTVVDGMLVAYDLALASIIFGTGAGSLGSTMGHVTYTDDHTLVLSDAGLVVEMNKINPLTLTIPPNATVAMPVDTILEAFQLGAGQLSIAAGAGVTIRSPGGKLKIADQYGSVALRQRAIDEWVLAGDLSA